MNMQMPTIKMLQLCQTIVTQIWQRMKKENPYKYLCKKCLCATHWYTMFHQHIGVHNSDQLMQEIRLGFKQLRSQFLHHIFQLLCCMRGHTIPCLGLSPAKTQAQEWTQVGRTWWCHPAGKHTSQPAALSPSAILHLDLKKMSLINKHLLEDVWL